MTAPGLFSGDWESFTLAELEHRGDLRLFRGKVISKKDIDRTPGDYPIYSSSVHAEGLFGSYGDYMFDEELITWSIDGGGHFFHRKRHKFSVTNVCGYLRVQTPAIDYRYLAYHLRHLHAQEVFDYTLKAHPSVIRAAYRIRLPRPSEQRAIATVLSEVDELIGSLEALIEKKRAIKQAAMQDLLTGRKRLPGFGGDWEPRRISQLADVDPENLSSSTDPAFTFNYVSLENVVSGRLAGCSRESFGTAPSRARRVLRMSDILMSTVRPALNGHLLYRGQVKNAVCSTGFAVLRAKHNRCAPLFLFGHLFGEAVRTQLERLLSGSNYPAISSGEVGRLRVLCPPTLEEQEAIAGVLSDMDAEMTTLEGRLDKTCAIREGMMQQLLSGSVRLPIPDEDTEDGDPHAA